MPWRSRMACTVLRNTALRRGERCPAAVSAAAIAWSLSPARARATMSASISRLRDRSASEPTVTGTVASVVAPPRQTMRQSVVRERTKGLVAQRLPELVDGDHDAPAIDELLNTVEQHHHQRRAHLRVVEDLRHVEAERRGAKADRVFLAVEHPAERSAPAPALEPRSDAFRVALAEEDAQRRKTAFLERQIG